MPEGKYRSISLSKELVEVIEDFIKENPQASYKSIADFVTDAVRIKLSIHKRAQQMSISMGTTQKSTST
jgi:metal-responsive CopG/Arc/MetJ family transcriptional regulator